MGSGLGAAKGKNVRDRDPDAADPLYQYRSDNQFDSTIYSAYASGPIIKDRLFFFAMAEGRNETIDIFRSVNSERRRDTTPQGLVKLDWYINDSNPVEFTGIYNQAKTKYSTYEYNPDANGESRYNVGRHEAPIEQYEMENGGKVGILKYTGYFTDNFTLSAQYGYLSNLIDSRLPTDPAGSECPWAYSFGLTTSVVDRYIGCNPGTISTVADRNAEPDEDIRKAFRVDGEWVLGDHRVRFGVDQKVRVQSSRSDLRRRNQLGVLHGSWQCRGHWRFCWPAGADSEWSIGTTWCALRALPCLSDQQLHL